MPLCRLQDGGQRQNKTQTLTEPQTLADCISSSSAHSLQCTKTRRQRGVVHLKDSQTSTRREDDDDDDDDELTAVGRRSHCTEKPPSPRSEGSTAGSFLSSRQQGCNYGHARPRVCAGVNKGLEDTEGASGLRTIFEGFKRKDQALFCIPPQFVFFPSEDARGTVFKGIRSDPTSRSDDPRRVSVVVVRL